MKVFRRFIKGILLKGESSDPTENLEGSIWHNSSSNRIKSYVESAVRTLVSEDQAQTLTNKTLDADNNPISNIDTTNLRSGVLVTDVSTATANTELPSALAVKTALEAQNEADEIAYDNTTSGLTATNVQAAVDEVEGRLDTAETGLSDHLADTVDAHDASAISNVPSGNLAATDVQAALNELQGDIDTNATGLSDHLADAVDAHDASAISNVPTGNLAATDVQAALNELQSDIDTRALDSDLTNHLNDTVDAHDASAISYVNTTSGLTAIEVQAAIDEIDSDLDSHLDGTASKHDATEIDYERLDGSKKNIQAASDDAESALTDLDDAIGALAPTPTNYTPTDASIVADHLSAIDTALASAGGTPTGNNNTLAFFNATGDLDSDTDVRFDTTNNSLGYVDVITSGTLTITGKGSLAHGQVENTGIITASGVGSLAGGRATTSSANITAAGVGSLVHGYSQNGGRVRANGDGSVALGYGAVSNSGPYALGNGAMAVGYGNASSQGILAIDDGSFAHGYITGTGATMQADGIGAFTTGYATTQGGLRTTGTGAHALANVGGSGSLSLFSAAGQGSMLSGYYRGNAGNDLDVAANGAHSLANVSGFSSFSLGGAGSSFIGNMDSTSQTFSVNFGSQGTMVTGSYGGGAVAVTNAEGGLVQGHHDGNVNLTQDGAIIMGSSTSTRTITSSGLTSIAIGRTVSGDIISSGTLSTSIGDDLNTSAESGFTVGKGHVNNTLLTTVVGRYSVTPTAAPTTWNANDPLFVVGNGASDVSRSNALEVKKDGSLTTSGPITSPGLPVWQKITKTEADFTAASTTETIELFSLPAAATIHAVIIKHTTAFNDTGSFFNVSVGITGDLAKYASAFDVFQAPGDTVAQTTNVIDVENFGSATSIKLTATSDVNVANFTAGSVDVYVLVSTLPA